MSPNDKKACLVSAFLSIAVLVGLGLLFAYPIAWIFDGIRIRKSRVGLVEFHGRTSTPDGNPISGVVVSGELNTVNFLGSSETSSIQATSDDLGEFSIGPTEGITLEINQVSKPGFVVRGRKWPTRGYQYWIFRFSANGRIPDSFDKEHPFTFTLDPSPESNAVGQAMDLPSPGL